MGEFRIGRKYAYHSYPEPRRGGAESTPFARNFARGPAAETDITVLGVQVPWSLIDVGSPGTDVPITPQSTGIIRIVGSLTIKNHSGTNVVNVLVNPQLNGVSLSFPLADEVTLPINALAVIPILAEATGLTVGVQALIQVLVSSEDAGSNEISISLDSSTLDVQEVSAASG